MELTLEIARYILRLQDVEDAEIGLGPEDNNITEQLESAFPILKQERLDEEFNNWLHKVKMGRDPRMIELRKEIDRQEKLGDKMFALKAGTSSGWETHRQQMDKLIVRQDKLRYKLTKEYKSMDQTLLRKEWETERMLEKLDS